METAPGAGLPITEYHSMLTLAIAPWVVSVLVAIFLFACVVLILTVLIQRPQGGGLSGAFGAGGGAGQTAFGTKTGDALTIATVSLFIAFLGLAIGLNFVTRPSAITPAQPVAGPASDTDPNAATTVADDQAEGEGEGVTDEPTETDAVDLIVPPAADDTPAAPAESTSGEDTPAADGSADDDTTEPGNG